jgi:hypothetical protein
MDKWLAPKLSKIFIDFKDEAIKTKSLEKDALRIYYSLHCTKKAIRGGLQA